MIALYPGVCDRCERTYRSGDEIVPWRGSYIHAQCAPGGDAQ